jgi:chemotaxis response regulator CheB
MVRVRILLARVPQMLGQILQEAIAVEPDLNLVACLATDEELLPAVMRVQPDVILLGADDAVGDPGYRALLAARPQTKVLTVSANERELVLHGLRVYTDRLGEASLPGLLQAIRAAARE